jgi:hypothetical protein
MNRPSHWILALFGLLALTTWATGGLPLGPTTQDDPTTTTDARPAPRPTTQPRTAPRPSVLGTTVGGHIEGRVIDRFGWPIAGVAVRVVDPDPATADRLAVTDSDGRFDLRVDGLGVRQVQFETADQIHVEALVSSAPARTVVLPDPLPWRAPQDWESLLRPSPNLLAGETAVELENGAPASGAWVAVRETGAMARTDDRGHARLPLRPGEASTLVAWNEQGKAALSEPAVPSRDSGLVPLPQLEFEDGFTFRGTLRDERGEPVPAPVRLREGAVVREAGPDADGYFTFRGLVGGIYELEVLPYRGVLGVQRRVEIGADVDLDIELQRDQPLQLRVVDRSSRALTGVHVVARDDANRRAHGVTDRDGEVVVRGLGASLVEFEVRDAELQPLRVDAWAAAENMLVVAKP